MENRISILNDLKTFYEDVLDPTILDVNILNDSQVVYLEVVKANGSNDRIIYQYALKNWDSGPVFTSEELGIKDKDDYSHKAKEFAHLSLPLFSNENDIQVSVHQFIDMFLMEKETLRMLTDIFIELNA